MQVPPVATTLLPCDLSIIIVSWNTQTLITQCLQTIADDIAKSQKLTVETLVVDNASSDNSVAIIEQHFPWVKLIKNDRNIGFAGANNQAMRVCLGRCILLLNSDTELKPGTLTTLVNYLNCHPTVGAVGPHTLNTDETLQVSCYPRPTLFRELWRLFHLDKIWAFGTYPMHRWSQAEAKQVDVLLGACILFRRQILADVGLMDEGYFMYSEEVDYCYRIQEQGWSLYWVPQAKIIHHGGQSTKQIAADMFIRLYQSKLRYFRKHYSWPTTLTYKGVLLFSALTRLLFTPFAWLQSPPKRQKNLLLANRYWQLIKLLPGM